jgi:hypothetical protein
MQPMNDWRPLRTAMVSVLLAVTVTAAAPSRLDTYTFTDEITGLAIDLPRDWERRDLRRMGATLSPSADEYHRRRHDSPVLGEIILIALATPYSGPPQNQPAIVCAANLANRSVNLEFVKTTLQNSVDMAFGRLERAAEMSQPVKVKVSGQDAYRMSVRNVDGHALGADFIAMPRGERLLQCFGVHDETHREEITGVLGSMRIEKVKTPTTKDAMQTVYARFGCDVTTFDILMAASDRRSGLSRKEAMNVRAGVVFKNRSSLYGVSEQEFRKYAGQVLDDAYGHPALDDAGLAAYQTYKCERLIAGQRVEPLARFEKALINCGMAEEPKSCRAEILAAGGNGRMGQVHDTP